MSISERVPTGGSVHTSTRVSSVGGLIAANENVRLWSDSRNAQRLLFRIARVVSFSTEKHALERGVEIDDFVDLLDSQLADSALSLDLKRVLDFVGSATGLIVLAPFLLLIAILVCLSSAGPPIFSQIRHGQGGRPFRIYKFRTMYWRASDFSGVTQTVSKDVRVTPIGRFLRRTNIDELTQLWNVLKGDMSLVGPRPHVPGMKAAGKPYEDLVMVYPLRHFVKPGITGLAQMRGFRGATNNPTSARMRIVCDLAYAANFSVLLDIKILFLTIVYEFYCNTGA